VWVQVRFAPLPTIRFGIFRAAGAAFWNELSDPLNFIVGAVILARYKPSAVDTYLRLVAACSVVALVLAPPLAATWSSKLGLGDPLSYGLTLVCAGAVTLIPGRVYALTREGRIRQGAKFRGKEYPKALQRILWGLEVLVSVAALYAIVHWKFGGSGDHAVLRAVTWAILAVSASDLITASASLNVVEWNADIDEVNKTIREALALWRARRAKRAREKATARTRERTRSSPGGDSESTGTPTEQTQ
jgi:hypothetical protein